MANRLSFEQRYKVIERLKATREEILQKKPTHSALAREIGKEFGFGINPKTLQDLCGLINLTWDIPVGQGVKGVTRKSIGVLTERCMALEKKCDSLDGQCSALLEMLARQDSQIAVLRGTVVQLCAKAGIPVPQGMVPHQSSRNTAVIPNSK